MADLEVKRRPIFVLDSPRTCSQLFNKLFANHVQLEHIFHPFLGASCYGPERMQLSMRHCDDAERVQIEMAKIAGQENETYSMAAQRLAESVESIQKKGIIPFVKDHVCMILKQDILLRIIRGEDVPPAANPTALADGLFKSGTPVMLIRHPALMIPSFYRVQKPLLEENVNDEECVAWTTLRCTRVLFEAYRRLQHDKLPLKPDSGARLAAATAPTVPIVTDAQDVVYNTKPTITALCNLLGIDTDGVQYSWPAIPREQWPSSPIVPQSFLTDLLNSTGVTRADKPAEEHVDLDREEAKWAKEFG